ncbi:MAG: ribonuclease III domain-containing protein [Oscillospiraceae bacterium]|nr:ribonuclease III domain-containing protein [Oscillospiraceae bacterium]
MITLPEEQNKTLHEIKQKSPVELAFVGDAVYELMVREYISLHHDAPAGKLHSMCVEYVRAEAQVKAFEKIQNVLTEDELDFVRKGRNANKVTASKNAEPAAYRIATGVETMFGYLYLTGSNDRIRELFNMIFEEQEA